MESRLKNRGAFTLVELLVVIAIIAVVATLGIAAFGPITRGVQLSEAARLLHGEINHARQSAVAFQRETEIRFFQTERLGVTRWSGLQILLADGAGGFKPLRRPAVIPEPVFIDEAPSTLLDAAAHTGSAVFGRHGTRSYKAFRFRPGGCTEPAVTAAKNSIFLRGADSSNNVIVLNVTPVNGSVAAYPP